MVRLSVVVAGLVVGTEAGLSLVGYSVVDRVVVQEGLLAWADDDTSVDALVDRVDDERLVRVDYYSSPDGEAWVS